MRIFHLSDLHIGIRLYNYDLREEQEYIFNEIIEKMQEYKPDVIVIAGDIYDRAMPSGDAIEMFDRFINKIRETDSSIIIMMISGNHDSRQRIGCYGEILEKQGLYMVGIPPRTQEDYIKKVTLQDSFGNVNFYLLPYVSTADIKGVLGYNMEQKIRLNQKICSELETMAKTLYDYWFVQFDFPNEEGKPYKSSGGEMVWNDRLKREIPEEWRATTIGEVENNIITGKTPSCADEDNFGGDIPFITIDDIRGNLFVFNSQRTLSTKGAESQTKKYLPIGSLSVSCIGTIGVMGFIAKLSQTNQQINSIVFENEYNKEFVYFALKLYFENAKAKIGNVFANMSKDEFASIKVVYPPKQILQAFHNKVVVIFDSIKNNINEINALTKQRDELLPLLMNGQITIE